MDVLFYALAFIVVLALGITLGLLLAANLLAPRIERLHEENEILKRTIASFAAPDYVPEGLNDKRG